MPGILDPRVTYRLKICKTTRAWAALQPPMVANYHIEMPSCKMNPSCRESQDTISTETHIIIIMKILITIIIVITDIIHSTITAQGLGF